MAQHSRRNKFMIRWSFVAIAVASFLFAMGAFVSYASVTLNGTGVTASSTNGNFLELTSSTATLFSVDNSGDVGANEFYGSTVSTTPYPNLSFTSSGTININAGGTNQNIDLNPTGSGATIVTNLEDKGGQVFNVKAYRAKGNGVADDTAAIQAAIDAACPSASSPGGTIYFPPGTYYIPEALTIPNSGAASPTQCPLRFTGMEPSIDSASWGVLTGTGSILNLTETSDPVGKIDTTGAGTLEIDHLGLEDTATDSIPFIHTTNTTIYVYNDTFTSSQTGTANTQDAIVLGGTTATIGNTPNDAFQGYGTVIRDNYFNRVRHAVLGQVYANNVQIVDNTVGLHSGSATSGDAPFVFNAYSAQDAGEVISNNLIEATNYTYAVSLTGTIYSILTGNSVWDAPSPPFIAAYYFGTGSNGNTATCGYVSAHICVDPASPGYDTGTTVQSQNGTVLSSPVGIGIISPSSTLTVKSSGAPTGVTGIRILSGSTALPNGWNIAEGTPGDYDGYLMFMGHTTSTPGDFYLGSSGSAHFTGALNIGAPGTGGAMSGAPGLLYINGYGANGSIQMTASGSGTITLNASAVQINGPIRPGDTSASWTSGAGTPSGSCTTGSLYTNTSGGTGTTLYVCEAGAWVAK